MVEILEGVEISRQVSPEVATRKVHHPINPILFNTFQLLSHLPSTSQTRFSGRKQARESLNSHLLTNLLNRLNRLKLSKSKVVGLTD